MAQERKEPRSKSTDAFVQLVLDMRKTPLGRGYVNVTLMAISKILALKDTHLSDQVTLLQKIQVEVMDAKNRGTKADAALIENQIIKPLQIHLARVQALALVPALAKKQANLDESKTALSSAIIYLKHTLKEYYKINFDEKKSQLYDACIEACRLINVTAKDLAHPYNAVVLQQFLNVILPASESYFRNQYKTLEAEILESSSKPGQQQQYRAQMKRMETLIAEHRKFIALFEKTLRNFDLRGDQINEESPSVHHRRIYQMVVQANDAFDAHRDLLKKEETFRMQPTRKEEVQIIPEQKRVERKR